MKTIEVCKIEKQRKINEVLEQQDYTSLSPEGKEGYDDLKNGRWEAIEYGSNEYWEMMGLPPKNRKV